MGAAEMPVEVKQKLEIFFSQYREREYKKGQVLILNGDTADSIYYLLSGRVKMYDVSYRGDEVVLNTFKPPAFFPMSIAINKSENPFIYEAETDIKFRQAPANEVVKFLKQNADVTFDLLSRLYSGTDGLLLRMAQLMMGSARSRLLQEIVLECRRFGEKQNDGSYILNMTEKDLGSYSGLSRETVNREVGKLKKTGQLHIDGHRVKIPDLVKLEGLLAN
jgi:CRP-like cAMP-binding protein